MSKIKGCKNGIRKNELYGVKVAFEYIEAQCRRERLPVPDITGGTRTKLIQVKYKIPFTYWNGVSHKGAVYKYKGEDLWKFIDLFMNDWRSSHKVEKNQPKQTSFFDFPENETILAETPVTDDLVYRPDNLVFRPEHTTTNKTYVDFNPDKVLKVLKVLKELTKALEEVFPEKGES